jgi:hypothetical protein
MGAVSYVPSMLTWDDEFGRVPSENPYADLDGDGRPEVAIGRLPVQTVEQARVVVDKIASQQEVLARAVGRHLFAVDNSGDADLPFREEADAVAASLPAGSAVAWADVAEGIVTAGPRSGPTSICSRPTISPPASEARSRRSSSPGRARPSGT